MIQLNIIPEQLKKNIELRTIFQQSKSIIIFIIMSSLFFSALLYGAKIILIIYSKEGEQNTITKTKQTEDYFNNVKNINNKIGFINKIQDDILIWSDFLSYFTNGINDNIKITKLSVNKTTKTIDIIGNAKDVNSLEELEDTLNKIEYLEDFTIPDELFFKKEDIDFNLKSKFINYEFNKSEQNK